MVRCLLFLALILAVRPLTAASLDPLVQREALWSLPADQFESTASELGFRWVSQARDSARAAERGLTLLGLPVTEAIARFEDGKLRQFTLVFYARGDSGEITREAFEAMLKSAAETLNRATKVNPVARGKDPTNAVRAEGAIWNTPQAEYLLEYSFTREVKSRNIPFRAEFVRLEISPPRAKTTLLNSALSPQGRTKFNGPAQVKRDAQSGDVFLPGVPMVDQGQKGYCVVASAERVLRYYGTQADANELAQIANSDAVGGTSYSAMLAALKKLGARMKVRVRPIEETSVKSVLALVDDYNRAAKKAGTTPVAKPTTSIDVGEIYGQMQFATLKEVRTKNRADFGRFQREVQQTVDEGVPLLWSVQLGFVPEPGVPQHAGGHMRLIIGYNLKTNEVIFSDSWGAGHEQKRMAMDDAWTITTGLAKIEPI